MNESILIWNSRLIALTIISKKAKCLSYENRTEKRAEFNMAVFVREQFGLKKQTRFSGCKNKSLLLKTSRVLP